MGGGPGNLWGDLTAKGDEHAEESNETVVNAPGPVVPAALTLLLGQPLPWDYVSPLCLWLQEAHPSPPLPSSLCLGKITVQIRFLNKSELCASEQGQPQAPNSLIYPQNWHTTGRARVPGHWPALEGRLLVTTDQRQLRTCAPGGGQRLVLAGPRYTMQCSTLRGAWGMRPSSLPRGLPQRQRVLLDPEALSGWEAQERWSNGRIWTHGA